MSRGKFNYKDFRFLVIDDQPVVRHSLRSCVQAMGGFTVDFAQGYQDAVHRIRNMTPDIVLCDYILGDGRSGQQLLEEVRRCDLLADEAIYIMITAEQAYEQVVACVELIPDDYILKPFSPELLRVRLDRLMTKKQLLRPFFKAKRERRYAAAAQFLDSCAANEEYRQYQIDFLRCEAELLLAQGRAEEAEAIYRRILEMHQFPWANVGVVRALFKRGRLDEARQLIETVIKASPLFFEAFELKAAICGEQGDHAEAQATLADVDGRSPRNFQRKRRLAAAALAAGDTTLAREVMEDVIRNDDMPGAVTMTDHLLLARASLDAGDLVTAETAIRRAGAATSMELDDRLGYTALRAVITPSEGRGPFLAMREVWLKSPMAEERLVDALRAALELNDHGFADAIARRLMDEEGVRRVFQHALSVYARYGRQQDFRNIQRAAALARIAHAPKAASADAEATADLGRQA